MGLYLPHKFHLIEHIYTIRDKTGHKKKFNTLSYPSSSFLSQMKLLWNVNELKE